MIHLAGIAQRGILLGVLMLAVLLAPGAVPDAAADITAMQFGQGFSCGGGGGGGGGGGFYTAGACAGSPADGQIFSYFVCKFEEIINEALSQVYCAIVEEARRPVTVALTLAVLFFGMAFLMGVSPFTAKELMAFAAKFSLVMAFALEAEYMIGIGYALFMNVAKEGIIIVLNYLFETAYTSANDVYRLFDDALAQLLQTASADSRQEGGQCQNALFSLMVLAAAALPPVAMMGMYFMVKIVWVMVRAVFGYCQGILGVTFLVTLAPIYVSFALFKPTRALFEKWIEHLISFSFQMVVVFAFLGMAFNIMSRMADDVQDYTNLVRPYNRDYRDAGAASMFNMCGICEMNPTAPGERPSCRSERVMEIGQLSRDENFLHFATVKIFAMIIMFYLLDIMLDFVPQMARHLAGPKYAAQLGGGDTGGQDEVDVSLPGEHAAKRAMAAGAQGFKGATTPGAMIGGFVSGGRQALREAINTAVAGAGIVALANVAGGRKASKGDGEPDVREERTSAAASSSSSGGGHATKTVQRAMPTVQTTDVGKTGSNTSAGNTTAAIQGSVAAARAAAQSAQQAAAQAVASKASDISMAASSGDTRGLNMMSQAVNGALMRTPTRDDITAIKTALRQVPDFDMDDIGYLEDILDRIPTTSGDDFGSMIKPSDTQDT